MNTPIGLNTSTGSKPVGSNKALPAIAQVGTNDLAARRLEGDNAKQGKLIGSWPMTTTAISPNFASAEAEGFPPSPEWTLKTIRHRSRNVSV